MRFERVAWTGQAEVDEEKEWEVVRMIRGGLKELERRSQSSRLFGGFRGIGELVDKFKSSLFAELVLRDKSRDEGVTKSGVAMVGDLADALGPSIKLLLKDSNFHSELLGQCSQSDDEQLRETASWVQGVISRVLVS